MHKRLINTDNSIAILLAGIVFVPGFFRFDLSSRYNAILPAEMLASLTILILFSGLSIWLKKEKSPGTRSNPGRWSPAFNRQSLPGRNSMSTEEMRSIPTGLMFATLKNKPHPSYTYGENERRFVDDYGDKENNELLMNIDEMGYIQFVTEETALAYGKNSDDFVGKNIGDIKHLFGIDTSIWFDRLSRDYHVQSAVEVQVNGQKKWIFWNFEAIINSQDMIDLIIASGQEITRFVNPGGAQDLIRLIDYQTSLLNQQGLFEKIANLEIVNRAVSFFIYLSNLSEINDYYGHAVGDDIIGHISRELIRFQNEECFVARISSGKFVGYCINQYASDEAIAYYLDKLKNAISGAHIINGKPIHMDIRLGYAVYPEDTDQYEKLISLSSMAMQTSSQETNSNIIRYQRYMLDNLDRNIKISTKLKTALDQGLIQVHFQKAMNVPDNKVVYLEELARWTDPELGYIPPIQLFKIAKDYNQLDRLERYLVDKAIDAFRLIRRHKEYHDAKLAINIAPSTLLDPQFIEFLNIAAKKCKVPAKDICIEISEGTFVAKLDLCIERIREYKKQGYMIALDDFGKDYSSLAILESFDFDLIKIDKLFIDKITDEKIKEIIRMIRKITELSGKDIIAEGVETEDQAQVLLSLGCLLQQGYYFHRPEKLI